MCNSREGTTSLPLPPPLCSLQKGQRPPHSLYLGQHRVCSGHALLGWNPSLIKAKGYFTIVLNCYSYTPEGTIHLKGAGRRWSCGSAPISIGPCSWWGTKNSLLIQRSGVACTLPACCRTRRQGCVSWGRIPLRAPCGDTSASPTDPEYLQGILQPDLQVLRIFHSLWHPWGIWKLST